MNWSTLLFELIFHLEKTDLLKLHEHIKILLYDA